MFKQLGPTEIILILLVVVLLFGAKKLPDLARGSGRALRIFKSETKGLMDDKDGDTDEDATDDADGFEEKPRSIEANAKAKTPDVSTPADDTTADAARRDATS